MEFTTDAIFESLKTPLGVIDDPERRRQIESYIEAARTHVDRAVFDLLSRFAEEVDGQVRAHYEVSLAYRPGVLDLQVRPREAAESVEDAWSLAEGEIEKLTLRIPAELKEMAQEAAARAGLSANSWFVRMLARSVRSPEAPEPPPPPGGGRHGPGHAGRRISGWVGPDE